METLLFELDSRIWSPSQQCHSKGDDETRNSVVFVLLSLVQVAITAGLHLSCVDALYEARLMVDSFPLGIKLLCPNISCNQSSLAIEGLFTKLVDKGQLLDQSNHSDSINRHSRRSEWRIPFSGS